MNTFVPNLAILPPAQQRLCPELAATPDHFVLYGGTALALRLGHRASVDFDFFSDEPFDPDELAHAIPYLDGAVRIHVAPNTLTCRVNRGGTIHISFFGGLGLGQVAAHDCTDGTRVNVASLLDLAGTKVSVIQKRAEAKDYIDIDALIAHGIDLPTALAAGQVVYGSAFNPLIALKSLSFFGDVPEVPDAVRKRLRSAVNAVDAHHLPTFATVVKRRPRS
jgi:hypothetical protein